MRQGRLAGRYPAVAAMVVCALVPYLALSGALGPITPIIAGDLHMSLQTMALGSGLANAAYAVGTVLAVQFALLLPQRRMMVIYAVVLVLGSVLTAAAQSPAMFIGGRVLQGLCTSLLLIAAAPPLFLGFPMSRLRSTAVIMNMCIFGAVALGPLIGGIQASAHAWRPLFWIVSLISVAALVLSLLTFEDAPPADPTAPKDPLAIALAACGAAAAFFGASMLLTHGFLDDVTIAPLLAGLALIVILIVTQSVRPNPLLTIRTMLTSTIPVAGIVVALFAAAASVSATELSEGVLATRYGPLHVGLLYLPEFAGAVVTAFVLGYVLQRRALQYLPLAGMGFLAAGILVFRIELPPSQALALVGSGLTGIGVGATVAPALFVAGFSLPSANLQRVFAIVELLRAVAAFMIAPVFAHFAATVGSGPYGGVGIALWIGAGLAVAGALLAVTIYALGGARPQAPDIPTFLAGASPAWPSPPLLARVRRRAPARVAAQDLVQCD
ncbi:MAG TPA: MFS transporter [Solirubrobacteraceae bacterium]|nr:MFS transporter [Solirubrobacteraceae bacterium]